MRTVQQHGTRSIMVSRWRGPGRLEMRETVAFFFFISPWIIGFLLFTGGPLLAVCVLSFTDYTATNTPTFIGLQNYTHLFADPIYLTSLRVTGYYTVLYLPISLAVALGLALLLNQRVILRGVFRTIFYLPTVISGVAVALLWQWLLNPEFGLVNYVLRLFGITGPLWFQDEHWVIPAFVLMGLWSVGGGMLVFLAALQSIPPEQYEAASLDGANAWHKFLHVTLPMISPALLFNLITGMIASFQIFAPAYVISNGNGGPNYASEFYALYLFNNAFQYFKFGYAAAQAWLLFLIILVLTILLLQASKKIVYYEN